VDFENETKNPGDSAEIWDFPPKMGGGFSSDGGDKGWLEGGRDLGKRVAG